MVQEKSFSVKRSLSYQVKKKTNRSNGYIIKKTTIFVLHAGGGEAENERKV
jgi:hypothetical protein